MTNLLSVYASLCHIYAEQNGGLMHQMTNESGSQLVQSAIQDEDTSVTNGSSLREIVDPNILFKKRFYLASKVIKN